ncbi:MAG: hypothetical protein AB1393_12955 [Candidatus Edwardsbacteria bacterium]
MRKCCQKKGFWSCAECDITETCKKLSPISKGYKEKNLFILKELQKLRVGG